MEQEYWGPIDSPEEAYWGPIDSPEAACMEQEDWGLIDSPEAAVSTVTKTGLEQSTHTHTTYRQKLKR